MGCAGGCRLSVRWSCRAWGWDKGDRVYMTSDGQVYLKIDCTGPTKCYISVGESRGPHLVGLKGGLNLAAEEPCAADGTGCLCGGRLLFSVPVVMQCSVSLLH
jgi:hypothetical protein